ncbi:MAG: alpha/beta fold hydrolase [Asgard group archaeon]|nr:alpha/beta fold hydrolase [Asgard group archaeon]
MNKDIKYRILLCIGLVLVLFPLSLQFGITYRMRGSSSQYIIDGMGNRIFTKYYPSNINDPSIMPGVMLFHGMGEDQNSLSTLAYALRMKGFNVFAVDFSGHGRSSGVIPSGESSDSILAHQVNRAKEYFKSIAGLSDDDIYLVGHSMGSRAVLKATQTDPTLVGGCVLIGSAIDVDRASNDSWIKDLGPDNPNCDIFILTGTWDDVHPPQEALRLFQTLSGNDTITDLRRSYITAYNNTVEIYVFNGLTHTHESMSVGVALLTASWIREREIYGNGSSPFYDPLITSIFDIQVWFKVLEVAGFFLLLIYGQKIIQYEQEKRTEIRSSPEEPTDLFNLKKFYWFKILIWVGAFAIGLVIAIILAFLPISIPYFTLIFFCPLAGYGIINVILYSVGKMPGYKKKWEPNAMDFFKTVNWWSVLFGIVVFILITVILAYFIDGVLYHVFPMNIRLAWLVVFTIISTLGFYMFQIETENLRKTFPNKQKYTMLNSSLFMLPFVIGAFVILFMGRIIFFVDAVNDVLLVGLVLLVGNLLQQIWKKPLLTGYMQSFLLFFLLLPRGQMTFMF